jgi:hypothetical protein
VATARDVEAVIVAGAAAARVGTRFVASSTPSRQVEGNVAAMALYAGEGVGDVREIRPAAAIVADLIANLG